MVHGRHGARNFDRQWFKMGSKFAGHFHNSICFRNNTKMHNWTDLL
jgi:hypothetical protein